MSALSHEIAREQIAYWKSIGWAAKDAGAALGHRSTVSGWRDVEAALAMAWRRLPTHRRFQQVTP